MVRSPVRNRMLLALPAELRERIMGQCRRVDFSSGHVIYLADAPAQHIFFIERGLVSLIKTMADGRRTEIGAVGTEGLIGLFAAHGLGRAIVEYVVQVPVTAWRIGATALRNAIADHAILRDLIERYLFLFVDQVAQASACNRLHSLEQRCCRWLLFAHDNAFADQFSFTHEFLAMLLGVQRPSLTTIANRLQKQGLIRYRHGHITILSRPGLEAASCECYRAMRRHADRAFRK